MHEAGSLDLRVVRHLCGTRLIGTGFCASQFCGNHDARHSPSAIPGESKMRIASSAVHRGGARRAQKLLLSGRAAHAGRPAAHNTPSTSAQTATMARNRVSDASARASSATLRTMTMPLCSERTGNIVLFLFFCQEMAVGQFELCEQFSPQGGPPRGGLHDQLSSLGWRPRRSGPRSLRVALGSQPVDAAGSLQPFVDFGFALEPLDISRLGSGIFGKNLPIILCYPLHFEGDSGFGHTSEYAPSGPSRKL